MKGFARGGWNPWVVLLWLCSTLVSGVLCTGDADAYSRRVALARAFGYDAFVALSAALCVTPVQRLLSWMRRALPSAAQLRRALGLAALASAMLHAAFGISSSPWSIREQWQDPHLRFGIVAVPILCALGATSFPVWVRRIRLRSWKELHRLAYVAWVLSLVHGLLSPYANTLGLLALAASVVGLGIWRLLPRRARIEQA